MNTSSPYRVVIPLLIIAVFVTYLSYWFLHEYYERYEDTVDNGWTLEAKTNPWLAAEKYLTQLGYSFGSYERIEDLEPELNDNDTPGTVIITDVELVFTEKRVQVLLDWVRTGGRLIVGLPNSKEGRTHPLMEHFGVTLKDIEYDEENSGKSSFIELMREYNDRNKGVEEHKKNTQSFDEWARDNRRKGWDSAREYELTAIEFTNEKNPASVHFKNHVQLDHRWLYLSPEEEQEFEAHAPYYWAGSTAGGTSFMEFDERSGVVVFLSDPGIWHSDRIDQHDHAWLLWLLSRGNTVNVLYGANIPPLSSIVWRSAPEIVTAFSLWLLFWLVYRGRRYGAIREQVFTQRRAIAEHIQACAEYLWRNNKPEALVTPLQEAITQRCYQLCPGWQRMTEEQQAQWLEQHISRRGESKEQITREQLANALFTEVSWNEAQLTDRVRALQKIRELLI